MHLVLILFKSEAKKPETNKIRPLCCGVSIYNLACLGSHFSLPHVVLQLQLNRRTLKTKCNKGWERLACTDLAGCPANY